MSYSFCYRIYSTSVWYFEVVDIESFLYWDNIVVRLPMVEADLEQSISMS